MPRVRGEKRTELKYFTPLSFGRTPDGSEMILDDGSRERNGLLIIGAKSSGKSEMIPELFWQDIVVPQEINGEFRTPISNACLVYVVSKPEQAYYLYAMGRKYHRNVTLLKPSTSSRVMNELIGADKYDYDAVNELVNFEDGIRKRDVFVVDMEPASYGELSKIAVGMVLMQLQIAMHKTSKTAKRRVFLTVDDAHLYLPYLESLLEFGSSYNIVPTLMFQSRGQYKGYEGVIESNIQNYLLLPNLTFDDSKHFSEQFFLDSPDYFIGRGEGKCYCSFLSNLKRTNTDTIIEGSLIDEHENENIIANAAKYRKQLLRAEKEELYAAKIQREYAKYLIAQNKTISPGTSEETMEEEIMKSIEDGTSTLSEVIKAASSGASGGFKEENVIRTLGNDEEVTDEIKDTPEITQKNPRTKGLETLLKPTPNLVNKTHDGLDLSRIESITFPDPIPEPVKNTSEQDRKTEPETKEEEPPRELFFSSYASMRNSEDFGKAVGEIPVKKKEEKKPQQQPSNNPSKKKKNKKKKPNGNQNGNNVQNNTQNSNQNKKTEKQPQKQEPKKEPEKPKAKPVIKPEKKPEKKPPVKEEKKEEVKEELFFPEYFDDSLMGDPEIEEVDPGPVPEEKELTTSLEDELEFDLEGEDIPPIILEAPRPVTPVVREEAPVVPTKQPEPEPIEPEPEEPEEPKPAPISERAYDESLDDIVITLGESVVPESKADDSFTLGKPKAVNSKRRFFGRPIFVSNKAGSPDEKILANEFNKKLGR